MSADNTTFDGKIGVFYGGAFTGCGVHVRLGDTDYCGIDADGGSRPEVKLKACTSTPGDGRPPGQRIGVRLQHGCA